MKFALRLLMLLCFAGPAMAAGDPTTQRLIRQAMVDMRPLVEFGELYRNGFYFLKKEHGRNIVEARTLLTPFYEIVMKVPVSEPQGDRPLLQIGTEEIELWRITRVYYDIVGELVVEREHPQRLIPQAQWQRLHRARGDVHAAGLELESGLRLQNLDKYRDQLRAEAHVGW